MANAFIVKFLSSSLSPCLGCAIYVVWNCFETGPILGAYVWKGNAPRMSHEFGKVGSWTRGNMRELRHLCWHSQPDFGE